MHRPLRIHQAFLRECNSVAVTIPPHVHDVEQWYACLGGRLTVTIEQQSLQLERGHGCLVPPGGRRSLQAAAGSRYLVIFFDDLDLDLAGLRRQVLAVPPEARVLLRALETELAGIGDAFAAWSVDALLTALWIAIRRQQSVDGRLTGGGVRPTGEELVRRVEAVLWQNMHRAPTRRELADAVGFSEAHLARLFKGVTGQSLHRYHQELRRRRAAALLRDSTLSVAEVAEAVGCRSASHFTHWFKCQTGQTATAYRQTHRLVIGG